jgi:very-short-patch-repair endonuclease
MAEKLTKEEFIERAINVHGNEYDYSLSNYINSHTKIDIICKKHSEFKQIANNHLNGMGCPVCGREKNDLNKKLSQKIFIEKAKEIHGDKYDYSNVNYTGALNYVNIICPTHGMFRQHANSHLSGRGCSKCVGGIKKTQEEFIIRAKEIHDNKYDYSLVKYINAKTNIEIICSVHGIFKQMPTKHLCGHGCPICNESRGENKITNYLLKNSIKFIKEKKFNGCKGKRQALPFDFYLPNNNTLIEFDGRQHYEPVNFHGCSDEQAQKSYFELKKNEKIKNNFANLNNYHLLRIKFDQINKIEKILESYEPISQ